jgi:Bacterial Ig domain/Secretion system C-terminal sorting domain/Putative flagellar system-associated repeat
MRKCLIILFLFISSVLSSQTVLRIVGQTYINAEKNWNGVVISDLVPTSLTFSNNSVTSINTNGYMLFAGQESPSSTQNNLDGAVITGNRFTWNYDSLGTALHGLYLGYNKNDVVEYNYLDKVPFGVIIKACAVNGVNMAYTSGGIAYNIVKDFDIGVRIKGMNDVCVYNNTFYSSTGNNVSGIIYISSNPDVPNPAPATGIKIKNNIFYSTYPVCDIYLDVGCEAGFESDYNVFYCSSGNPKFFYRGVSKTFTEWQALGYDLHSVVVNPNFNNTTDLIPTSRLDYGIDLGSTWKTGLSTTAAWTAGSAPATADQNGSWQVGARIYDASSATPFYISSVVENITPNRLEMTYSISLANIVPAASAFNVQVNLVNRTVNSVSILNGKVRLTLAIPVVYGDIITVTYSKPANNPLQTSSGNQAASLTAQTVINNCINLNPTIAIISPVNGSSFTAPANITITTNALDVDGSISKVEFFNGSTKLDEKATAPFSFTWNNVAEGVYLITAVATDNFNAKTTSSAISVSVTNVTPPVNKPPAVNIISPANGRTYTVPAIITITVNASDSDGTISKLTFFNGTIKIGEITSGPYLFSWTVVNPGTYTITVMATDNSNSSTISNSVEVLITPSNDGNSELINLFPNPNTGHFTIEIIKPLQNESNTISIVNFAGKKVYDGILLKKEITKQFNLSDLDLGIYILMISGKEILTTKKFIKN